MAKKRTVQHISNKKRGRPRVKFNFGVLVVIFVLSFAGCFALYMLAANLNDDFLNDSSEKNVVQEQPDSDDEDADDSTESPSDESEKTSEQQGNTSITNPVPQSEAVDVSYLESCCLITDSTLIRMADHTSLKDVIGSEQLGAAVCNEQKVESTYGTVTVYQTMQLKKPTNLYIMLGSDIGVSSVDDMISAYTTLVNSLHNYLPDTKIYIMQLPPVYINAETLNNDLINQYNSRLLDVARNTGVYCIDTNTALKSAEGNLSEEYWNTETGELSESAYKAISDYIRTHTA